MPISRKILVCATSFGIIVYFSLVLLADNNLVSLNYLSENTLSYL